MNDLNFSKLTASLEELSLTKQLPLRQQVSKPILKYDTSVTKPIQLFKHADLSNFRQEGHSHGYGTISQTSSGNAVLPVRYRPTPPTTQGLLTTKPGQTYLMPSSPDKLQSSKAHSNPYARPLSAKDIVSDLQNQKLKKSLSTSQMASNSTGSINLNNISSSVPFQMNSFMRPQSAVRKDPKPKDPSSPTKAANKTSCKPQPPPTEISPIVTSNDKDDSHVQVNPTDTELNEEVDEISKVDEPKSPKLEKTPKFQPKIATGYHINRVASYKSIEKTSPQKTVVPNKVVSSIPRPGAGTIVTKTVSSPEPPRKIRNLNYTPTKPFVEVAGTGSKTDISARSPQKASRLASSTQKSIQTTTDSLTKNSNTEMNKSISCMKINGTR